MPLSRVRLSGTVAQCEEILNLVETEESRLKFDVDSLRDILTSKDPPLKEDEPNGNGRIGYNASPIVVETKEKSFTYRNIDDLLDRVVTEEGLAETAGSGSSDDAIPSKLVDVLRKGVDHKFIESKQLLATYFRERKRHKNPTPEGDPARFFLTQLEETNDEDLSTLAKRDVNLAEALPKYIRAVETKITVTTKVDSDSNFQRNAIQAALDDALLTDIAGLSGANQTELIQLVSTVQATMDFVKSKKLVCVKMEETS